MTTAEVLAQFETRWADAQADDYELTVQQLQRAGLLHMAGSSSSMAAGGYYE